MCYLASQTITDNIIPTNYPSVNPTECLNQYEIEKTYVQYTPLSETPNMNIQTVLDNRQKTLNLRFLFAENGVNPWEIDIENGQTPQSPFIGQIIMTLTDETQEFRMYFALYIT